MNKDGTEASFARLLKQRRRRALIRRVALVAGLLMLGFYAYLGFYHDLWGTGMILVPAGLGCIVGWAIEEAVVQISKDHNV